MSAPATATPSLVERAADIYDLKIGVRHRPAPQAPLVVPSVAPEPAVAAPIPAGVERSVVGVHPVDRGLLADGGYLVPGGSVIALAEEFRLVKRQLLATRRDHELAPSVLICSARPNEGKTFCAINLAISLAAERDLKVLLVDADVVKPDVARRLGLPEHRAGLLDALADPARDVEAMVMATDIAGLSVLPAGTRTSADTELLASAHAARVLARLATADPRRMVLFDSPPALSASAASALAMHVGQVAMVVRADRTAEADLREAVALLGACDHLHLMLNAVSYQPGGPRFGSYYEDGLA